MQWWLGQYLKERGVDQQKFKDAFSECVHGDFDYMVKSLDRDVSGYSVTKLLNEVETKPQKKTFRNFVLALNNEKKLPDVNNPDVIAMMEFHKRWQQEMSKRLHSRAQYREKIVHKLELLCEDGYSLHRLISGCEPSGSVEAYAGELDRCLSLSRVKSTLPKDQPMAQLIGHIREMLTIAESKHMSYVVHLALLLAYHFVSEDLQEICKRNRVVVGNDEPAAAVYRLLQNFSNDVLADRCDYEKQANGVRGAVPIRRETLSTNATLNSIGHRLEGGMDDIEMSGLGEKGWKIKIPSLTPRGFMSLNSMLVLDSKLPNSRFAYALDPAVFDDDLATQLKELLPALKYYSHETEVSDDLPEIYELNRFLTKVGELIEEREYELKNTVGNDPLDELSKVVAEFLKKNGKEEQLASAPKTTDRIKYIKWFNELLKTDKLMANFFKNHPEFLESIHGVFTDVTEFSAGEFESLSSLLRNI